MNSVDIFPWNEHFNTGLITVDKQHKKLVDILNSLASHIAYNSSEDDLNTIFDELANYTIYHFETEEAIWHKYLPNDSLDSDHQAIHQQFVKTILKLKAEQDTRPLIELAEEALGFLARWLASHILETDRYMAHLIFALRDGSDLDSAKQIAKEKMGGSTRLLIDIILSIYGTLSTNTLRLMRELKSHQGLEKEVDEQHKYRDMLLELSTNFINLPLDEIDHNINKALKKMVKFLGVDRAYIFDYDYEVKTLTNTYEWCETEIISQIDKLQNISIDFFPDWIEAHSRGEYILIQDLEILEKGPLYDILSPQKIKSLITFPIYKNSKCSGFFGFDAVKEKHIFSPSEIAILEIFSKLLSNIAERKHNESELLHERSFLKTLFQAIPDLIWIKDVNGVFLLCNSRFEDFFGVKETEIIGKTDYDFVDKSLADSFRANDNKVMESAQININEEKVYFASDGHEEILQTTKVPIYDKKGKINGVLGVARDISSIKKIQKELEHKEHYQRALLDNFPFMIWLKDEQNRFLAINKSMANACGFVETKDIIGKTDYDIWPKELADSYSKDDTKVFLSGKSKTIEEPIETLNGRIWAETYKSPVSINNKIIGTVGFSRDITSRKELEQNLLKEKNLFENYLNTVESIIVSLDLKGHIILVNRKACELLGYRAEELIGKQWFKICLDQPEGMQKVYPIFKEMIKGKLEGSEYNENKIVTKSKKKYLIAWHNSYLRDAEGNITGTLSSGEDITLLKEQQKRLEHLAHFDTLTNLPNRLLLSDRLNQAIIYAKRHKSSLATIFLDLDSFKEINDTHGHANGDILLKIISNRIQEILRESDTIARLGGDEFAIILHDLKNKQDCLLMLKRILAVCSAPVISNDIVMQVSASMGVTFFNQSDKLDADQLLRQSDHAMYQAKLAGKNRFHIFDAAEDENLRNHNEDLDSIERALNNNEFIMYYQPKVNMRNGKFLGAEALIRWNHPTKGLLSPGAFLPIIENHNLLVNLDSWVIKSVIEQIQKWKKEAINIVVSINLSAMKLQENNFIDKVINLLDEYPEVKASDFIFEILETSALEDISHISYIMKECNNIGIDFSLDDFGTGYSSLSYLKNLPAKQLKIDQSFVRDMLDDVDDMAILEGVISLASAFRREVIAEGVESIEQGKMLLRLGCEQGQGYVIAKPMPAQKLEEWIKTWKSYPQWENIEALSRDDLPILYAITEHKIWIKKVIAYINKEEPVSSDLDFKNCRFGIWLYNQSVDESQRSKVLEKIKKLHLEIHNNINAIVKQHIEQPEENTEHIVKKILGYRDKFLEEFKNFFF